MCNPGFPLDISIWNDSLAYISCADGALLELQYKDSIDLTGRKEIHWGMLVWTLFVNENLFVTLGNDCEAKVNSIDDESETKIL